MSNKNDVIDALAEIGIRTLIIDSILKHGLFGPSKKEIAKQKEKAIKKKEMCQRIYYKGGIKYAEYLFHDEKNNKDIRWTEEIKEDPFHLY